MRISARCDYACKALLELSLHWPNKEPMRINAISSKQKIPLRYLVQILIQLKRMGLVDSVRGPSGGYVLARAPEKIKLGEVLREIGGPFLQRAKSMKTKESVFEKIWDEAEAAIETVVDKVTFEDICNKVKGADKILFYNI
jgi:Rrf2 family protein